MIHSTSPIAASAKWLRISGGRILDPASRADCMPPRETQIESRTKPPPAVRIHAMSAIHSMVPPRSFGDRGTYAQIRRISAAPLVRDRQAPIAAERLRPKLDPRRSLPALVLGAVDHRQRAVDDLRVEPVSGQVLTRLVELDVGLEHAVEIRVRRQ